MKLGPFMMPMHPPEKLHSAVGGFGTILQLIYDWGNAEASNLRSMQLLAQEVMPQLADLS